jgi:hypothetical protein
MIKQGILRALVLAAVMATSVSAVARPGVVRVTRVVHVTKAAPEIVPTVAAPKPTVPSAPSVTAVAAPQVKASPSTLFVAVTKAELLALLRRSLGNAQLQLATAVVHDGPLSLGARFHEGQSEAYRAAVELAELLE